MVGTYEGTYGRGVYHAIGSHVSHVTSILFDKSFKSTYVSDISGSIHLKF